MIDKIKQKLGLPEQYKIGYLYEHTPNGYRYVRAGRMYKLYKDMDLGVDKVEKPMYDQVLKVMNARLWDAVIRELYRFHMPYKLGSIYIVDKVNSGKTFRDWSGFRKTQDRYAQRYNLHTKGKRFGIKWNKDFADTQHVTFYKFVPVIGGEVDGRYVGKHGLHKYIMYSSKTSDVSDFYAHLF